MVSETPTGPEFLGFSYFPIIGISWFPFCLLSYFIFLFPAPPAYMPFLVRTDRGFTLKKSCPALLHPDQKGHTTAVWGLLSWIQGPRSPGLQIMGERREGTWELAPSSPFQFLRVLSKQEGMAPSCVQTVLFHCRVPSIFFFSPHEGAILGKKVIHRNFTNNSFTEFQEKGTSLKLSVSNLLSRRSIRILQESFSY